MGLESGSKKRNLEASRFGYEGLGKETWEGVPSYSTSSNGNSQLREAEEIRKILEGVTLSTNNDDDIDYEATVANVNKTSLEMEELRKKFELLFEDEPIIKEDITIIESEINETTLDKNGNMVEQQAEAIVEAMVNGTIDVDGNQINNSVPDLNPKQMGFTAFQMLALVSFTFSGLILIIGTIAIAFMK